MAARRRTTFPGLPPEASRELIGMQDDLQRDTAALRQEVIGTTTDTKTATYSAKFNEIIRVQMPAAGGSIIFPAAVVGSINRWIEMLVLAGSGPVKLTPTSLQIDGAATVTLTTAGRYSFRSDGLTSWWRTTNGASGGGGSQGWDDTLAIDATSGANDPIVNVGRFIQFGAVGPTTSNPQIRSGDATFRIRGGGNVFILADGASGIAALAATANGGTAIVQGQGTGGTATLSSLLSSAIIDGNAVLVNVGGVTRISIANTGEWITPVGASGQVWTHQGAGLPPTWGAAPPPATGSVPLTSLATQGANTVVANATAGVASPTAVALATNEVLGRTGGNLTGITAAIQSALIRGSGNLTFSAAAAGQFLGRSLAGGDLQFQLLPGLGVLLRTPQIVLATNAAFAHPTGTRILIVEGVGGGGGGGGCAATQGSCGSGGNSGNWGRKAFTSISGTSNITIGTAGTTASGVAGGNGGNSSLVHNAVTFTLPGGIGGTLLAGAATVAAATLNAGNAASTGADLDSVGQVGQRAYRIAAAATAGVSGSGGSNPLGSGGPGFGGVNSAGAAATGRGAGGGGAVASSSATAAAGGPPTAGAFIVWEFG